MVAFAQPVYATVTVRPSWVYRTVDCLNTISIYLSPPQVPASYGGDATEYAHRPAVSQRDAGGRGEDRRQQGHAPTSR